MDRELDEWIVENLMDRKIDKMIRNIGRKEAWIERRIDDGKLKR